VHMSNVMNTPVEVIEGEYPVTVEEQALRPGSAGDGAHRGGLGFRRAYRIMGPNVTLTSMLERRLVPPYGLAGGGDAAPFRLTLNPGTPGARDLRGKETLALREGDVVLIETCGGGGYGPPAERPPALRAQDRREGYTA
jgi:N-methylhydantoinase B